MIGLRVALGIARSLISLNIGCQASSNLEALRLAMTTKQAIGQRIAAARKAKSLTQEALGARLGRGKATISLWEKSQVEPDLLMLGQLARELSISLDWLLLDGTRPAAFLSENLAARIEQMPPEVRASLAALLSTEPQKRNIGGDLPKAPYTPYSGVLHEKAAEYGPHPKRQGK